MVLCTMHGVLSKHAHLQDLAAQRLGEAARRNAQQTLHVLDNRGGERELACLLHHVCGAQVVLHHELRKVADHLGRGGDLTGGRGGRGGVNGLKWLWSVFHLGKNRQKRRPGKKPISVNGLQQRGSVFQHERVYTSARITQHATWIQHDSKTQVVSDQPAPRATSMILTRHKPRKTANEQYATQAARVP